MGGNKSKREPPSYERGELYDDTPNSHRKITEMLDPKFRAKELTRLVKRAVNKYLTKKNPQA